MKSKKSTAWRRRWKQTRQTATTITMENNQKQITDEENDFVICFEKKSGGQRERQGGKMKGGFMN